MKSLTLHSMKNPPPEKERAAELSAGPMGSPGAENPYPYGMRLNLDDPQVEALGVDITELHAGQKVRIEAEAEIVLAGSEDRKEYDGKIKARRRLEIQVTRMGMADADDATADEFDQEVTD